MDTSTNEYDFLKKNNKTGAYELSLKTFYYIKQDDEVKRIRAISTSELILTKVQDQWHMYCPISKLCSDGLFLPVLLSDKDVDKISNDKNVTILKNKY